MKASLCMDIPKIELHFNLYFEIHTAHFIEHVLYSKSSIAHKEHSDIYGGGCIQVCGCVDV